MNNKILIIIIIPNFELEYELYIPNNKKIGTIKKYFLTSINEMAQIGYSKSEKEVRFIDRQTGIEYENNMYVKDSGIKNGSIIVVM